MNEAIKQLLDLYTEDGRITNVEGLAAALTERENAVLDDLRLKAAQLGLRPAITQQVLIQVGLGDAPDPEYLALIARQAEEEQQALAAQSAVLQSIIDAHQRRHHEGGDGG